MGKYLEKNPHSYSQEYAEDRELRKYFADLALKYLSLIKLHRESGHLPSLKNLSPEQAQANTQISGQADWSGVVRHCLAEAGAADAFAKLAHLTKEEKETLIQATILHDFDKRVEIETLRGSSGKQSDKISEIKTKSREVLLQNGINKNVVDTIDGIGDTDIVNKQNATLLQKALFYIDNITEGTNLVSIRQKYEHMKVRYPKLAAEGFYDKWISSTEEVQKELSEKIGLNNPSDLPQILLEKINEIAHYHNIK